MSTSPARAKLFAFALAAALSLGACGSDSDSDAAELPTLAAADDNSSDSGDSGEESTEEDSTEANSTEEDRTEVDPEQAMAEYEKCLSDFGVDLDFSSGGGASIESIEIDEEGDATGTPNLEDFEAATEQCDAILEDAFGDFELTPEQEAEQADQTLEYERCMASAGFDIDTSEGFFELDDDIDFEAFEAANESCAQGFQEQIGSDQ